jgi:hypothetical protein
VGFESLCRQHLAKIASSVTFSRAGQLRSLLEWIGDRSLAAHTIAPKEKEIASSVLRRKDFDPQADSLVRKEMSRLREKLARYYRTEGASDPVRICASGGYLFSFEPMTSIQQGDASCWLMLPLRSAPENAAAGERLMEDLFLELDARGGPRMVAFTTALGYRGRVGDVRQFATECGAGCVVEGSLRQQGQAMEAAFWLVDGHSGRAIKSKRFSAATLPDLASMAGSWLLERDSPAQAAPRTAFG